MEFENSSERGECIEFQMKRKESDRNEHPTNGRYYMSSKEEADNANHQWFEVGEKMSL
jgi:hypothetical protein